MRVSLTCGCCLGSGLVNGLFISKPCPECSGEGFHYLNISDKEENGMKFRIKNGTIVSCPICKNTQFDRNDLEYIDFLADAELEEVSDYGIDSTIYSTELSKDKRNIYLLHCDCGFSLPFHQAPILVDNKK